MCWRDLTNVKPTLRTRSVTPANVDIDFNKSVSHGVRIFTKRGNETEWTLLALDTEPPYVDTRPNLAPGPETRYYRAQYILNDDPIGEWSEILVVTVPG